MWLYQGNVVYDITDTDCREQNGCAHDFLTFRHQFLTKRMRNWVKNCYVFISDSTPTGMAHNTCSAWFSFNINTWISPNDSTLFHFTNVGGTTLMSSCEPEFTHACIHAHRHALTSHPFVQLNQKCSLNTHPSLSFTPYVFNGLNNNNTHSSCAHQCCECSHDTY